MPKTLSKSDLWMVFDSYEKLYQYLSERQQPMDQPHIGTNLEHVFQALSLIFILAQIKQHQAKTRCREKVAPDPAKGY